MTIENVIRIVEEDTFPQIDFTKVSISITSDEFTCQFKGFVIKDTRARGIPFFISKICVPMSFLKENDDAVVASFVANSVKKRLDDMDMNVEMVLPESAAADFDTSKVRNAIRTLKEKILPGVDFTGSTYIASPLEVLCKFKVSSEFGDSAFVVTVETRVLWSFIKENDEVKVAMFIAKVVKKRLNDMGISAEICTPVAHMPSESQSVKIDIPGFGDWG